MKDITTNKGITYKVLEIYNDEWAIISKNIIANAIVMNAVHIKRKTGAQITILNRKVLINEDIELMSQEKYDMWSKAVENFKNTNKKKP